MQTHVNVGLNPSCGATCFFTECFTVKFCSSLHESALCHRVVPVEFVKRSRYLTSLQWWDAKMGLTMGSTSLHVCSPGLLYIEK